MNSLKKMFLILSVLAVSAFYLSETSVAVSSADGDEPVPGSIQPADIVIANLLPGLKMHYYLDFSKTSLTELPGVDAWAGEPGDPVDELNSSFGRDPVFSTGSNNNVGVRLNGYLYCDVEGTYFFQALSNDGIRLYIGDVLVLDDPEQHADRLTGFSSVEIAKPGYYPIRVEYFQIQGTAALKVFWKKPDHDGLVPIPKSGFWHTK